MEKQQLQLEHQYRASNLNNPNAPLIIMLHGYGSDENDLFSFASELPSKYAIISLKAPYGLNPHSNAWYAIHFDNLDGKWSDDNQAIKSREMVVSTINEIIEKYPVDKNNITLLGFSQGTILGLSIALSYPEKIKNLIGLSGYVNIGILKEDYQENDFKNLNIYSSHGTLDQVIPLEWAIKTKKFLSNIVSNFTYNEFPVGHGVSPQNFYDFKNWLEKHS
jgi:phospholipase/carboxylesterase|tara:strand:+ start:173 stop:832 length:660 start_codon:yes stop_codon:yes gene_type:complete